jgi:hypothetical protein
MASGLSNQPKLLKGAFVDSNLLSLPPLIVPFQFNPDTITRQRQVMLQMPASGAGRDRQLPDDQAMGESQTTIPMPEAISFDLRLDATDKLADGDPIAGEFGVLPALSALELMATPRSHTIFAGLLGLSANFGFGDRQSTPVVIFVWGRQRFYPVRITSLQIRETDSNPNLNPTRVVVGVSLQAVPGPNPFNVVTALQREVLAALNLQDVGNLARSIVNIG